MQQTANLDFLMFIVRTNSLDMKSFFSPNSNSSSNSFFYFNIVSHGFTCSFFYVQMILVIQSKKADPNISIQTILTQVSEPESRDTHLLETPWRSDPWCSWAPGSQSTLQEEDPRHKITKLSARPHDLLPPRRE